MDVRNFKLSNGNNAMWTLTDPSIESFATNPSGLGFNSESQYMRVGNDNLLTYSQYSMESKSFDVMFYGKRREDKYKMYFDFVKFLMVEPIYLLYEPVGGKTYRMKVKVESLGKTEINPETSALVCPMEMTPLSFWEDNKVKATTVFSTNKLVGKSYPLERPYYYAPAQFNNISLECQGTLPSPMIIEIDGNISGVQYSLLDSNAEVYGVGRITGSYDHVEINTDEAEESIVLENGGAQIPDPYNYQDLTIGSPDRVKVTFVQLKPMEVSTLNMLLGIGFEGSVNVRWRDRYLTV